VIASFSERKSHARRGAATINATVDAAVAEVAAAKDAEWKAAKEAAAEKEANRVRLTREDCVGAKVALTKHGWRKVVRVNKTTVSLETGYSWTDRVPFEDLLEVRK
jgi:hypothetical protein